MRAFALLYLQLLHQNAGFLAGGVLDCNLANRRSVAELKRLFMIKSNPMYPLSGALPLPYVPARVTRGTLVAHKHSFAPPRCRTSQYRRTFVPLSVSLWNDLIETLCLMVWDWRVSKVESMLSCRHDLLFLRCLLLFYLFLPSMGWLCVVWVFGLIECSHSLPALHSGLQIIIIIYHDHDFLPTPRRGSHVKSGKTHAQSSRYTP